MVVEVKHHMNHHMVPRTAMAELHTQAMTSAFIRVASTAVLSL